MFRSRVIVQLAIGVVILLYLLQLADASKVLSILLKVNLVDILLASLFFIIDSTFVALALYTSVKSLENSAPMGKVLLGSFAGQLLSDVTPARSGYLVTPLILKELANIPVDKGMVAVLAIGIVNSFMKAILSAIALMYFMSFLSLDLKIVGTLVVGMLFLLGGGVALLIILMEKRILKFIIVLEKIPIIGALMHKLVEMLGRIQKRGVNIKKQFPQIALLILLSMIANATALKFISNSLGFRSPSLIEFLFITAIVGSLIYIPFTIAGLGVQETGYVLLLTLLDMPFETAVAFALLARALFTGTDIIGLPALIILALKKHEAKVREF